MQLKAKKKRTRKRKRMGKRKKRKRKKRKREKSLLRENCSTCRRPEKLVAFLKATHKPLRKGISFYSPVTL